MARGHHYPNRFKGVKSITPPQIDSNSRYFSDPKLLTFFTAQTQISQNIIQLIFRKEFSLTAICCISYNTSPSHFLKSIPFSLYRSHLNFKISPRGHVYKLKHFKHWQPNLPESYFSSQLGCCTVHINQSSNLYSSVSCFNVSQNTQVSLRTISLSNSFIDRILLLQPSSPKHIQQP